MRKLILTGAALGVATLATVLASRTDSLVTRASPNGDLAVLNARVTAFHQALFAAAVLAALGIVASLFVHDSDAEASMLPRTVATAEKVAP